MFSAERLFVAVCAWVLATMGLPAYAGGGGISGGSTEWTQIANNAELVKVSLDSAQTAKTTVDKYILQYRQYENELANLARFAQLPQNIQHGVRSLDDLRAYRARLERLNGSLSDQSRMFELRFAESRLRGGTWEDYVASVRSDANNKNQRAINRLQYEQSVMNQVQNDYAAARELEPKIQESIGAQQSLQLMNTQMNRLVLQNAKLTEVLTATMHEQTFSNANSAEQENADLRAREALRARHNAVLNNRRRAAAAMQ